MICKGLNFRIFADRDKLLTLTMTKHFLFLSVFFPAVLQAQQSQDSIKQLKEVTVTGIRNVHGTGHMPEVRDGIIYSGKKNEVILVDSLDANKAINSTRQILGRIPGLNIVETESGGFTANGIGTRGLNPTQSIEMNTRQNGYNISADIYGNNEAYYLPPMEAVSRIEMVRGAASLQFGSQFGGMVNYVLHEAPTDKKFEFRTSLTGGSYGMINTFNSIGGTLGKWSYYGYGQYRYLEGWRPNSRQSQFSGFGRVQYKPSAKATIGLEYTILRNEIKMPGGLTDSMFNLDPRASYRTRNWLKSPWNILTGTVDLALSDATSLKIISSFQFSNRSLVWKNQEGGAGALDEPDPVTGEYQDREVEIEDMNNSTTELRLLHNYKFIGKESTLAAGARFSYSWFTRQEGEGNKGTDFNLEYTELEQDSKFITLNAAPFIENIFHINERLSVTPGVRFEYLFNEVEVEIEENGQETETEEERDRFFPLFGVGFEYRMAGNKNFYANISQAYRPMDYSQLTPIGVTSVVDPNMKDARGFNADLGYRGTVSNFLNFDVGLFYLAYNDRIGTILMNEGTSDQYTLRTNVANSVHKGFESYIELNVLRLIDPSTKKGLSIFNSFGYTDARYTSGEVKGNRVETAVKYINRIGLSYYDGYFSSSFQMSNVGDAYGDATNVELSDDPVAGYIPAYTVLDFSLTYKFRRFALKGGVNNITDKMYFTRRTDEYPGPGIIPAIGRTFYAGFDLKL
jgi:Fe(3+) dicitrate transport protein